MDINDFRTAVCERYSPDELVDILDISVEELFDAFEDYVIGDPDIRTDLGLSD